MDDEQAEALVNAPELSIHEFGFQWSCEENEDCQREGLIQYTCSKLSQLTSGAIGNQPGLLCSVLGRYPAIFHTRPSELYSLPHSHTPSRDSSRQARS